MKKQDALNILGLAEGYSEDDIKKAYRSLSSKYHPDKEGGSNEKMSEINAARDALINNTFDQPENSWHTRNNGGRPDFSEFEKRFYRGEDIKVYLHVSLKDLINGKTYTVNINKEEVKVEVIPGETFNGTVVQLRGKGMRGMHRDSESGDLYVIISCKDSGNITFIDRYDTCSSIVIDVYTATYGGFVEAETPHGKCRFNILPNNDGFKNRYRLKGKGMPMTKSKQLFGNHFVDIEVKLPTVSEFNEMIKGKTENDSNS